MKFLMCHPDYFHIDYEINPWMSTKRQVNESRAIEQWKKLHQVIQSCGAHIELVPPARGLPDMCFAANAGLFYKGKVVLANFKVIERKGEVSYFQAWFEKAGFKVVNKPGYDQSSAYFEGAGDALLIGDQLFVGYGFRSEKKFYEEASYLDHKKTIICELVDPYYYHIDTCFCPLNEKQAIWYPSAFSKEAQKRMAQHIELIEVIESEAKHFACNAVVINKNVIIPSGCPHLTSTLEKHGFTVHSCAVDEYIKAGGACKCLTMRLD